MSNGTLGTPAVLPLTAFATMYAVPAGKSAIINFNLVNTSNKPVLVRVAFTTAATPGPADWIEYDAYLRAAGDESNGNVLERSAFAVEANLKVMMSASVANAVVGRVYGVEK